MMPPMPVPSVPVAKEMSMPDNGESLAGPGFLPAPVPAALPAAPAGPGLAAGIALPVPGRGSAPPPERAPGDLADGPALRSFLGLGALASPVPCARLHARLILREWGLTALIEDIELLVSELVTNGLQASGTTPVRMWLLAADARGLILVRDASPQPPVRMDIGADAEHGRGLLLVEAVSHRWGWYPARGGGKVVWALAVLPVTADRTR
jgi:anti-sigma regulatory factor (Ser/Thr protein kinase)